MNGVCMACTYYKAISWDKIYEGTCGITGTAAKGEDPGCRDYISTMTGESPNKEVGI